MENINEDSVLRVNVKKSKMPGISVIFMGLIIIGMAIVLIIDANNKNSTYIAVSANIYSSEKGYQAGKPYYKVRYQYIVNNKKYYYDDPVKHFERPDDVITLKYNKQNPKELYITSYYIYYIIGCGVGVVVLILGIIKLVSLTSKNAEKIVVGEIFDALTCIGGKKYYIRSLDASFQPLPPEKTEYFSYFSNDYTNFKIGKKVKFNAYKYKEALLTDNIGNNRIAFDINELKINDFIFYK